MKPATSFNAIGITRLASFTGIIMGFVTIWVHLEIAIAEINVDLANLKKEMMMHKAENRSDLETLRNENDGNTREILRKVDEIQIYLRNAKK
jgi:hypothetical protein